jgi:hypothetical protein
MNLQREISEKKFSFRDKDDACVNGPLIIAVQFLIINNVISA